MNFKESKNIDFLSSQEIEQLQEDLLTKHLNYLVKNSAYYKNLFRQHNISISDINTINDLSKLPTTSKDDLEKYNRDFLCLPPKKIVEYVTTSGTTGSPITIALSANDVARVAYNEARALQLAGITEDDVVQITATLDKRFMAGMAYYLGLQKIGAASIRTGVGKPEFQWDNIMQFNPTTIIGVPSFMYKLGMHHQGKMHANTIKKAICIGEPLRNSDFSDNTLAQHLNEYWDIDFRSTYASTEMATAFTECEAKKGGHLLPELIILEVIDDAGNPVGEGELGEITITPLGVEGMPLLRFRTGDLARKHSQKCTCGRNTPRLGPIEGRKMQMIKLKGTTIFPQQIENIILLEKEIDAFLIEIKTGPNSLDDVFLYLEDSLSEALLENLKELLRVKLRVNINISILSKKELMLRLHPAGSRKPMKIIDNRNG